MTDDYIVINTNDGMVTEPYDLVPETDPILKKKLDDFVFNGMVDPVKLKDRLIETVKKSRALGLAANQCGLEHRVFVMGAEENYFACFNPVVTYYSDEYIHMPEYCLSFPFLELNISRPKDIEVKFQNETGEFIILNLSGISARVYLHELDHLNGITFNMVAKPLALKNGNKKREKHMKRYARTLVKSAMGVNQ